FSPLLNADLRLAQQAVGFRRGKPFVPEMYRQAEFMPEFLSEPGNLLRLRSCLAAHAQRISQNNLTHAVLPDELAQPREIRLFVPALKRIYALGGNAQQIRDRQSHAAGAVINGQDAA